ncbi:NAD(P)-binding protein [Lentithecium fluviatile CBS 122367]|uniref:NAD(P)-binding protein n=1 Tax=Lentithecium fluviatile CBS 122367 TaxID=1168545 RepID=A0A6G1JF80_9PLEO|nr:NAD(P)-binding protein [Lentithecium fluviatile CBS 122367]
MTHNILITGGSGYLGGSLLSLLSSANLPPYSRLYALVRTDAQAEAVRQYAAEPLTLTLSDPSSISAAIIAKKISVIFHLFDARDTTSTVPFIEALSHVKKQTGQDVHFLFTTGAKLFSEHAGAPTDRAIADTDPEWYEIQKQQEKDAPHEVLQPGVVANNLVIDTAEAHGVRSYIFAPCIVYGRGLGFGNVISIQTVAVVRAAKALRRVYKVDAGKPTWPVCHIEDNTSLYIEILRAILEGRDIGHGKEGYYLASPGSVAWDDIYATIGKAMKKRGAVDDESVGEADVEILQKMGEALGCPKELVGVMVGGLCTFEAKRGKEIGWKPKYKPEHILDAAEEEVDLILENLKE